jgi:hypothetical protein
LWFNRVGVFPGSLGNYSGKHKNVPVVTIELSNAQAMPSKAEVRRIWQDMLSWIENNVPHQAQASGETPPSFGIIKRTSAQPAPKADAAIKGGPSKNADAVKMPDATKG